MKSMTGYGRACVNFDDKTVQVECRSVNHRYLDCTVKAPRQYAYLEEPLKRAAASRVARGKLEIYVTITLAEGAGTRVTVNHALAAQYVQAINELAARHEIPSGLTALTLSHFSEVLGTERVEQDAELLEQQALSVLTAALDEFAAMRIREGERLRQDIEGRLQMIEQLVTQVEQQAPNRVVQYRERLLTRMREALSEVSVDESRILTEAAIYADKTAVDEETVRLRSHLGQLGEILQQDGPVGRKIDFLVQELNREANTIGSKANDLALSHIVVDIKSEIEKIREQIQNIE